MKNDAQMLAALFMNATEGIIVSGKNGVIVMANPNAERQFGYAAGELEGLPIEALVPRKLTHQHVAHRENYIKNPHPRSMGVGLDLFALRKDGSVFPVEISLSYFKTAEREYVMSFVIDITQRKEQDEYIRKMNKELENRVSERTKALAKANKELALSQAELTVALTKEKELNELKSRFVTTASHEFRTPLAAILSSVSLIDRYVKEEDLEKRQKHIYRIKSMVTNLTDILNDFLSIGKLEEGIVRNTPEPIEIISFLESAIDEIKGVLKDGQYISLIKEDQPISINLDSVLLKNIVFNLISNAIKYSPENKEILVSVHQLSEELVISVKDNGIGIPAGDLDHVFERFYRAKNSTNIQGTGLGLNITKRYVELMGGKIVLESELEAGTKLTIIFPLDKNQSPH